MSTLTSGMLADQAKPAILMFGAVEILLPGYSLRLVDGAGQVTFGGHTFVGRDATYGTLAGLTGYTDGVDDVAPSLTITLMSATLTAQAAVSAPGAQGSQVSIWVGDIDMVTGAVIADPDLAFVGELDVPTWKPGKNKRTLELAVVSAMDRFFDQDEGARLNNGFHQSIWPGETGFEFVSQVQRQIPWGNDNPRPNLITDVPQGGFGNPGYAIANYNFPQLDFLR